jgi:hypothetical protein
LLVVYEAFALVANWRKQILLFLTARSNQVEILRKADRPLRAADGSLESFMKS